MLINVKTGSSHYNQLSVVTSYRGISDYYSNKVVITTSVMRKVQLSHWEISLNLTRNNDNIRGGSLHYLD